MIRINQFKYLLLLLFLSCMLAVQGADYCEINMDDYDEEHVIIHFDDDESTLLEFENDFTFTFFGQEYTELYVNTNGNVTFDQGNLKETSDGDLPDENLKIIAPFWSDIQDVENGPTKIYYKFYENDGIKRLDIVWFEAHNAFEGNTDVKNTFKLVLSSQDDPEFEYGNMAFVYGDMEWATADTQSGFGGTPAMVGFSHPADPMAAGQIGKFAYAGDFFNGPQGLSGIGWLMNQQDCIELNGSGNNTPPIPQNLPEDNLILLDVGVTQQVEVQFLSPEVHENTEIDINLNDVPGFSVIDNIPSNPPESNMASVILQLKGLVDNVGTHDVVLTATDDGVPVAQTQVQLQVKVNPQSSCDINFYTYACFAWTDPMENEVPEEMEEYVFEPDPLSCEQIQLAEVSNSISTQSYDLINDKVESYEAQYLAKCTTPEALKDVFEVKYQQGHHHYMLYYYDRAGNLIRTVPPAGVDIISTDDMEVAKQTLPSHELVTTYDYNSLGQLVRQHTPDGGESNFYYDDMGKLRFSVNAQQVLDGNYSYTKYDELGRIIEVGESNEGFAELIMHKDKANFPSYGWQRTVTVYSDPTDETYLDGSTQRYLQNRVSYSYLDADGDEQTTNDRSTTYYSYDAHGNVEWQIQKIPHNTRKNYLSYEYDLLSGKMLQVNYNEGLIDQFYHRYSYDADNRITQVETSTDGELWEKDARYDYYAHGPLARTVIGEDEVQGIDYAYTVHGLLKGMNHSGIDPTKDLGRDGATVNETAKDAFAMALNYYEEDYYFENSGFNAVDADHLMALPGRDLYNGNISSWTSQTQSNGQGAYTGLTGQQYIYDELDRIKSSQFNSSTNDTWASTNDFYSTYSYDANGNLQTLNRNAYAANGLDLPQQMDELQYEYIEGTNRLKRVLDMADEGWNVDVVSQDGQDQNYEYDAIGNLIADKEEGITEIAWTPYGKVASIKKDDNTTIEFYYDAQGNRVNKRVLQNGQLNSTYYSRDTQGNVMALYEQQNGDAVKLTEQPIYGSERVGQRRETIEVDQLPFVSEVFTRKLDNKEYELKDHLNNVRAVVSDRKLSVLDGMDNPGEYTVSLQSYNNYYPFGMLQPGRNFSSSGYRYGFQGQEMDNELKGTGNSINYKYRMHDPRIGRFFAVDPLAGKYPHNSSYAFSENRVIDGVELEGLEWGLPRNPMAGINETFRRFGRDVGTSVDKTVVRTAIKAKKNLHKIAVDFGIAKHESSLSLEMSRTTTYRPTVAGFFSMSQNSNGEYVSYTGFSLFESNTVVKQELVSSNKNTVRLKFGDFSTYNGLKVDLKSGDVSKSSSLSIGKGGVGLYYSVSETNGVKSSEIGLGASKSLNLGSGWEVSGSIQLGVDLDDNDD